MQLRYKGAEPREVCPVDRVAFDVEPGQTVEVDDALGENLLMQIDLWERPPAPKKEAK